VALRSYIQEDHAALLSLSRDDLIALIVAQQTHMQTQAEQIAALTSRIAELEAKLAVPPKTPDNSSLPPSKGQKLNLPGRGKKKPRPSRPGVARHLAEDPDYTIEALVAACRHSDHALGPADLPEFHAYDHVDMPTIQPITTRIHRHRGVCPCCRRSVIASVPDGMEPGSPFGPGIAALVLHLHVTKAISFERLSRLMDELFGLTISEGAIANILARAEKPLLAACVPIAAAVRASLVVGSDETSARVGGKTWWQWVLLSSTAICHVIVETRAASVVTAFLDGAKPEIWVADRYGGQLGMAPPGRCVWRICYATRNTPSRRGIRCSHRDFTCCCYGRWRLASGGSGWRIRRSRNTTPIWNAGWIGSYQGRCRRSRLPVSCSARSAAIATTCSGS
jgi:transposase